MTNDLRTILMASVAALALPMMAAPAVAGDRALVVGIDSYPTLGLDPALRQARSDARRFQDFLIESKGFDPDDITLLLDDEATSGAIMDTLIDRLVGETGPGDRVYFYFSGLGSRIVDTTNREADGLTEVLLAYDANSLLGKMPEDAFADILDLIPDRDVTLVIDASNDGDMGYRVAAADAVTTRGVSLEEPGRPEGTRLRSGPAPINSDSFLEEPFGAGDADRTIWAAAAPGQFAWETPDHGVFTDAFLAGAKQGNADANGNGVITNAEMLTFLREQSEEWCASNADCAAADLGLTPHFSGLVQEVTATLDSVAGTPPAPEATPEPEAPTLAVEGNDVSTYAEALGFVTDLFTPSNSANLKLSVQAGDPMKIGDIVEFTVTADRPGTLVLLDVNPNGELAQVYPSTLSQEDTSRMTPGQTLVIPNGLSTNGRPLQIRVTEPVGEGFLLGIFVEDDLPTLEAVLPENLGGGPIPNAGQYLYEIAQDLLQMQADATGNSAVEWSAVYLPYQIVR